MGPAGPAPCREQAHSERSDVRAGMAYIREQAADSGETQWLPGPEHAVYVGKTGRVLQKKSGVGMCMEMG